MGGGVGVWVGLRNGWMGGWVDFEFVRVGEGMGGWIGLRVGFH